MDISWGGGGGGFMIWWTLGGGGIHDLVDILYIYIFF